MFIQLTTAGLALLQSGPFVLTGAKFGSAYDYVPDPAQTDINGAQVYYSVPGPAFPVNGNVVRYSVLMDRSVGDFDFGEIGFFAGATLVAVAVNSSLIHKGKTVTGVDGNMIRVDAFLSMVGTTYEMWLNLGDTDNKYVVASADLVDYLPPVHDTEANAFIVGSVADDMLAFFAYSDRSGIWAFDQYKYSTVIGHRYNVVAASAMQVTIAGADLAAQLDPEGPGARILQFTTGACYSICRNIQQALEDEVNDQCVLIFNTPLAVVPAVGDEFLVYNRDPLSTTTINIPIANRNDPGIVRIGDGLEVEPDGLIYVNRETIPNGLVYSIIGKDTDGNPVSLQGDVVLHIRDIVGGVASVNGQVPDANGNVTISTSYTLPVASPTVLGGVRISPGSGLTIDPGTGQLSIEASGQEGVKTINGRSPDGAGNAQILGLIDPQDITTATDFNTVRWPGIYNVEQGAIAGSSNLPVLHVPTERATLEVAPLDAADPESAIMQRWTQANATAWRFISGTTYGAWFNPALGSQIIATTTRLGSVKVGAGLNIAIDGTLSSKVLTVGGVSPDGTGNIEVDASTINAIPYPEKGAQGGVATLDAAPDPDSHDPVDEFVYGRIPYDQLALRALAYKADWDASTNSAVYTDDFGTVHTLELLDNGRFNDTYDEGGGTPSTVELPGLGSVFYTGVPGSTTLDGVSNWAVGDLVIGLTGKWIKVSSVSAVPVQELQFGISIPNEVTPSSVLFFQVVADTLTTDNTKGHRASARIAPTTEVVFEIQVDGVQVGTVTFDNSTTGVVDFPVPVSMSPSSEILILSPADVSTLYGLAIYLTFDIGV